MLASVSTSACRPAPPLGSVAANASTIGGSAEDAEGSMLAAGFIFQMRGGSLKWDFNPQFNPILQSIMTTTDVNVFKTYMCLICGFHYDESAGLPDEGIAPG